MRIAKHLSSWTATFAALFLSGYGSVSSARPITGAPLKENEGIVLLSVTNNTGLGHFTSVAVEGVPDPNARRGRKNNEVLTNVTDGLGRDTAMFIGIVPAGEYTIIGLSNYAASSLSLNDNAQALLGTLRVEAGAVADLGRIVVTPVRTLVIVGRSRVLTSNVSLIRRYWPEHAAHLDRPIASGWTSLPAVDDVVEDYAFDRPVGAEAPIELGSGEVLAASRLGALLVRSQYGIWRATRTGRLESLLSVAPAPGGAVDGQPAVAVAVGEYNTMARVDPDWNLTLVGPGNLPPGTLLFVCGDAESGWYVAQREAGPQVSIYHSARFNGGDWELLRTVSVDHRFWSGSEVFWIWPSRNGFAYAVFEGSIHELDYATGAWTERQSPDEERFVEVIGRADGTISAITTPGGVGGMARSVHVSRNGGADWAPIAAPSTVRYLPRVLLDGTLLTVAGKLMKPELQASADGGATWAVRPDTFRTTDNIVVLPTRGLLAIDIGEPPQASAYVAPLTDASIRHSADGGATWRVEYSNWK